jgi:hypothetical protein
VTLVFMLYVAAGRGVRQEQKGGGQIPEFYCYWLAPNLC